MLIANTACFTGHRPNKLLGGYDYSSEANLKLADALKKEIIHLYNSGITHFICGGALGVDQIAFSVLQRLRDVEDFCITIELAIPFEGFESQWIPASKKLHSEHIILADKVTVVDKDDRYQTKVQTGKYHPLKMEMRNRYMVDNSFYVIAVFDGSKSGTANCINYAEKHNREISIINPNNI